MQFIVNLPIMPKLPLQRVKKNVKAHLRKLLIKWNNVRFFKRFLISCWIKTFFWISFNDYIKTCQKQRIDFRLSSDWEWLQFIRKFDMLCWEMPITKKVLLDKRLWEILHVFTFIKFKRNKNKLKDLYVNILNIMLF